MKYSIDLKVPSSQAWLDTVLNDFDSFLQDHADCERKASAMAMSFVARYPDRLEILPDLIDTGVEELEHFRDVYALMEKRNVPLRKQMPEDLYVKELMKLAKGGSAEGRFMTHLLLASVIECRGCERFRMVAESIQDPELARFYKLLWASEAKHGNIFVEMALKYFPEKEVYDRLEELMELEGKIIESLPLQSALH